MELWFMDGIAQIQESYSLFFPLQNSLLFTYFNIDKEISLKSVWLVDNRQTSIFEWISKKIIVENTEKSEEKSKT